MSVKHGKYLHDAEMDELIQMKQKLTENNMTVSVVDSPIGKNMKNLDSVRLFRKWWIYKCDWKSIWIYCVYTYKELFKKT